jgi:hypothetical protein
MITCPWCGTSYATFQSNCDRCGGPLPPPAATGPAQPALSQGAGGVATPPPPPRPVSERYAWRLLMSDGWGVVSFVFVLLGAIFALLGAALTAAIITAFVGLPFLVLGLAFLAGGGAVMNSRFQSARQIVAVLRTGQPATGQISSVEENFNVRINNQHPWTITYAFRVQDQEYQGSVNTLNLPGPELQPGRAACVLYLPEAPQHNSLYPHP